MASLGTRKFWAPIDGIAGSAPPQILKMSGYINIVLHSVHYHSKGGFWQGLFGGSDKITLVSTVTYKSGSNSLDASAVQNISTVKANRDTFLGLGRIIALKIPADCDGLELGVEISAVESDNFGNALNVLNSDDARKPLELAAPVVGQVLMVTTFVKKLFTLGGTVSR